MGGELARGPQRARGQGGGRGCPCVALLSVGLGSCPEVYEVGQAVGARTDRVGWGGGGDRPTLKNLPSPQQPERSLSMGADLALCGLSLWSAGGCGDSALSAGGRGSGRAVATWLCRNAENVASF